MSRPLFALLALALTAPAIAQTTIPRATDGKPDLQGIWQAHNRAAYDLRGSRRGTACRPAAASSSAARFRISRRRSSKSARTSRTARRPIRCAQCFLPGVPRIMYMEYPFQIFQTAEHVAMTFEWSQVYRLDLHERQPTLHAGIESWMGNSRGRWEGDTLVVEVTDHNDRTWLDAAGNFHSNALRVTERYTLRDANTIDYEVTIDDPKVFTRPWKISMPLHRQTDATAIFEYQCQAEIEEANGAFERDDAHVVSGGSPGRQRTRSTRARGSDCARSHVAGDIRAACPTASPISRLVPSRRRRRQLWARDAARDLPDAGEPRHRRRSARRHAAVPGLGARRARRPASCRIAVTTIRPRTASSPAFRARITCRRPCTFCSRRVTSWCCSSGCRGGRFRSTAARTFRTTCASGRATPSAAGKATRSSSRRRT